MPQVSVITSISLEHTAILGDTLSAIAKEKAGIVKQDGVLVHAPNPAEVIGVFKEVCAKRGARIIAADESRCEAITMTGSCDDATGTCAGVRPHTAYGADSELVEGPSVHGSTSSPRTDCLGARTDCLGARTDCLGARTDCLGARTDYLGDSEETAFPAAAQALPAWGFPAQVCAVTTLGERREVRFPLRGRHQRLNLSVALAVVDELAAQGMPLSVDATCTGIEAVRWPGRFEQLSARPLVIADGAHTPDAMACLRETLTEHYPGRSIHCVLGTNQDKNSGQLLDALLPVIDRPHRVPVAPSSRPSAS